MSDFRAEGFRRFLTARHIVPKHSGVKCTQIRNLKTGTAMSGRFGLRSIGITRAALTLVESPSRAFSIELRSTGRLEFERHANHVSIERYGARHIAYKNDRIINTHVTTRISPYISAVRFGSLAVVR